MTLHHAAIRVIADTQRHAGHADIVRELMDGAVGMREDNVGVPEGDAARWEAYRARIEQAAREAGRREDSGRAR
ncbi:hypothetical protein RKD33_003236 [Streptomyces sp. SAI-129]